METRGDDFLVPLVLLASAGAPWGPTWALAHRGGGAAWKGVGGRGAGNQRH